MRVEVITRHAVRNYGSALQAVATHALLQAAGADVRFVDYRQPGYDDTGWSYANRGQARHFNLLGRTAYGALRAPSARRIGRVFEQFLRKELELTQRVYRSHEALSKSDEFSDTSFYCVGSDQVWNLDYNVDNRPYYLDFAPPGAFKFSLSSSIGASRFPPAEEARIVAALDDFGGISVRENDAVQYLASLGVSAEQHVDPTLGVEPSFWSSFAKTPNSDEPYVLVYQLNGASEFNPVVDAVSSALKIPVKRIEYWRGPRSLRYPSAVLPTMEEFVGLFKRAAFVVTDSFHGTIFSTTFQIPFVAVAPPKYAGRIVSLLELTSEEARLVSGTAEAADVALNGKPLRSSEEVLAGERARLQEYLFRTLPPTRS